MNNLIRFLVRIRVLLLFLCLEIIALVLFTNGSYYQQSVVLTAFHAVRGRWHQQVYNITAYLSLRENNIALAEENASLLNQLARHPVQSDTASILVNDLQNAPVYSYIPAEIIDISITKQHNYIVLNKGKRNGVKPDMGIICSQGVIGVVESVSDHYAFVKSILNIDWKFNVRLKQSGDFGPLQWDGANYRTSILSDIPQHSKIQAGDTVCTSGYSQLFPQDIPVGIVREYEVKRGTYYEIKIDLFVDLRKIRHVNIVNCLHSDELKSLNRLQND